MNRKSNNLMKPLELKLILYLVFLMVLTAAGVLLVMKQYYFSAVFVLISALFVLIKIYAIQMKSIEMMLRFISAVQFSDFSISFKLSAKEGVYRPLAEQLDSVLNQFRERLSSLEGDHQYYNTLLSTIDSGLLVIDKKGEIEWINQAAKKEFGKSDLRYISELRHISSELPEVLATLRAGDIKVVRVEKKEFSYDLIITGILFSIQEKDLLLVSLKDIHAVLEKNEIEAWQKLIRVLTHEIMNTIAPIISLSETVTERVSEQGMTERNSLIAIQAMETIHRRSKGLLEFVENYRKLTRIPTPIFGVFPLHLLFDDLKRLFSNTDGISVQYTTAPDINLLADRSMIEQILINLIKNAFEAKQEGRLLHISVEATVQDRITYVSVKDDGCGIAKEAVDKIFVPFFTTKPSGSGIGLSLCRQIMNLHGGTISVTSQDGQGSLFLLRFPLFVS